MGIEFYIELSVTLAAKLELEKLASPIPTIEIHMKIFLFPFIMLSAPFKMLTT